jgi:hypothetical protein
VVKIVAWVRKVSGLNNRRDTQLQALSNFCDFVSPCRRVIGHHIRTSHDRFYSYPFQFIIVILTLFLPIHKRTHAHRDTKTQSCRASVNDTHTHTHTQLAPLSRVLPEKLRERQLLKKFPAFSETRRFITAFTTARHLSLS